MKFSVCIFCPPIMISANLKIHKIIKKKKNTHTRNLYDLNPGLVVIGVRTTRLTCYCGEAL